MKDNLTEKSSGKFMLTLTTDERKRLKVVAVQKNTTMNSIIKHLIHTKKSIEDL